MRAASDTNAALLSGAAHAEEGPGRELVALGARRPGADLCEIADLDLRATCELLAAAQMACEEAASAASRFASELSFEPGELELAEERAHELEGLRRKHVERSGGEKKAPAAGSERIGDVSPFPRMFRIGRAFAVV